MLTEKDEDLVSLLRENARMAVSELARRLGVSRSTVQDRLKRLEASGAIEGYSVRLGRQEREREIAAFVTIGIKPQSAPTVISALKKLPKIDSLYTVSGKMDLIAIARTRSAEAMDKVLDEIGKQEGVQRTESAIILSTRFDRKRVS
ncbi:MAG: Lrp/AsnC family transcriptional regulator [Hyphomicrobiales bacterium]